MTVQELAEKLLEIARQMNQEGITLWGGEEDLLDIRKKLGGEILVVEPIRGCNSETCTHFKHSPAAATFKWIPPQNTQLVRLGGHHDKSYFYEWFAVFQDGKVHFIETVKSPSFWGEAQIIHVTQVPEWALDKLHNHAVKSQ